MNPTVRYELHPGEWRPDPPHVSYGCDRSGLVALLNDELSTTPWTQGESDTGPAIEVQGRTLKCPPNGEDLQWLETLAAPAPYGRGEHTLLDPTVRDALQIGAERMKLGGAAWEHLRGEMLRAVAADMGLAHAGLRLEPLKLLMYRADGHFSAHADTEKAPGMVASLSLIVPGEYEGGALTVEHAGETLRVGAGGTRRWRWAAWYADCRHCLERVEEGTRMAITFGIAIDPEKPLTPRQASSPRLGWALYGRTFADWHTTWAARGNRARAGGEQYGQKTVWVLSHRYTEPGLRASLLKARDRELAQLLVNELHGEACYLAWLQIREVGSARTAQGKSWGDDTWYEPEDPDDDPPPASLLSNDDFGEVLEDPAPHRIAHRETPELHLKNMARQNVWIEGLRSLGGDDVDHGPIEVLDGEIVPRGALAHAVPQGARVYEATGNEGASLELQYRHAVLVLWRRNAATLRNLARCGGRLALAVEFAQRSAEAEKSGRWLDEELEEVFALWEEAVATDGGEPEPRAHRVVLDAVAREEGSKENEHLRERYVTHVAAVDLEAEAAPRLAVWFRDRLQAGKPVETWVQALRPAYGSWARSAMHGAPGLLRALYAMRETQDVAVGLLAQWMEPPTTAEAVLHVADALDQALTEKAWRSRRTAKMTMDVDSEELLPPSRFG